MIMIGFIEYTTISHHIYTNLKIWKTSLSKQPDSAKQESDARYLAVGLLYFRVAAPPTKPRSADHPEGRRELEGLCKSGFRSTFVECIFIN